MALAGQHHLEAVVVARVVAARHLNAAACRSVLRGKVQHGRGHHPTSITSTPASCRPRTRAASSSGPEAAIAPHGHRALALARCDGAKGPVKLQGDVFVQGSGDDAADVIGFGQAGAEGCMGPGAGWGAGILPRRRARGTPRGLAEGRPFGTSGIDPQMHCSRPQRRSLLALVVHMSENGQSRACLGPRHGLGCVSFGMPATPPAASPAVPAATNDSAARYLALKARDARFDGHFFTGVTSTGIDCRPVCRVRTPKRENCRFFVLAAQAEAAGFRPCLRCRPSWTSAGRLGGRNGRSGHRRVIYPRRLAHPSAASRALLDAKALERRRTRTGHGLERAPCAAHFRSALGITPLQYLQTRRLLAAKQRLTDTNLGMSQIARLSGFASVRRFNAAFLAHYRLQPTAVRKTTTPYQRQTDTPGGTAHRQHTPAQRATQGQLPAAV